MNVAVHDRGPVAVTVELDGELDLARVPELERVLERVRPVPPVLVVDLSDVTSADAAGAGFLGLLAGEAEARGTCLRVWGARPPVARVLRLLGLGGLLVGAAP
ncbi:STAS domain-containing protein [Vallicoccus soli]|nr:STAS domain-containing protein [Vallicoccus soli]